LEKVRISEIAQEAGRANKDALEASRALGILAKSIQSSVTSEQASKIYDYLMGVSTKESAKKEEAKKESPPSAPTAPAVKEPTVQARRDPPPPPAQKAQVISAADEKPLEKAKVKSGLRIVNKRNSQIRQSFGGQESKAEPFVHAYGKNKVALDTAQEDRHKRKERRVVVSTNRKEAGQRIEMLSDRELDSRDAYEDEVVLMPDLSIGVSDFLAEQERKERTARKDYEKAKTLTTATGRIAGTDSISRQKRRKRRSFPRISEAREKVETIEISEDVRVYEFAEKIKQPISAVIKKLFDFGTLVTKNDFLGKDTIEILSVEFGIEVRTKDVSEELDYAAIYDSEHKNSAKTAPRPPIVTIMGHVDHGKTSLLDYIRSSRVASGEAGGITQHIGAYTVRKDAKRITFIDTPGHEAFSQMRSRGANTTDIVIIVVAADDGVMPQTKEAISHANAAKCPIVVAINKIDKPSANIDKVKAELAEAGLTPLDWGGDIECVGVSAKSGAGIETLLETILLQAELMELKAETDTFAKATVIESSLEKGRGAVATVIVQNGTLKVGDFVVSGVSCGRIRTITNDHGAQIERLEPSEAGLVVGLDAVPSSGDVMVAMADIDAAKEYAQKRSEYERSRALSRSTKATLEDLGSLIAEGKLKRLPIILKADVQGTLEAIASSISKLRNEEVKAEIVHSAVGEINASDVALSAASENAIILGFHVKPSQIIKDRAKSLGVRIYSYDVIYDLLDDVSRILSGMLSKVTSEELIGKAEVRQMFDVPKRGRIAGCMVIDGEVLRGAAAKVIRGEDEIYGGTVVTLRRFKEDVKEVKKGLECGIGLDGSPDIQSGDLIQIYKTTEVAAIFKAES
jgi:translation initiation factor IF-2